MQTTICTARWKLRAKWLASIGLIATWGVLTGLAPQDEQLLQAAREGNLAQMETLLKQGATVNAATEDGWTPLYGAALEGHEAVARLLLEKGAHVNAATKDGVTPLHGAAWKGHEVVARLLLEKGAHVAARNQDQRTPLHLAAEQGHAGIIALLLAHDAYVGVKDRTGETPLDVARRQGRASIVQMLEAALAGPSAPPRLPSVAAPTRPAPPRSAVDVPPTGTPSPQPKAHAVVVGIERYRNALPPAEFAARDAETVETYLLRAMGYPAHQVAVLRDDRAAKADLEKYVEHWLPDRVGPDDTVLVYFSGHGAPNPKTGEPYLVPYDGDPAFIEATGYPVTRLYGHLAKLPAKEVIVVLDACFSGAGGRSVLAPGMRPVVLVPEHSLLAGGKVVALTASTGTQVSGTILSQGHGLLTYFLLKGLKGEADQDRDGMIGLEELYRYVRPQVEQTARKELHQEQTPQLLGDPVVAKTVRLLERATR